MNRRSFLQAMLAAAAAGGVPGSLQARDAASAKPSNEKSPNFIIIFVDDQGYQDLG